MFPIKSEPFLNIQQPMMFINSHTFHTPPNINVLKRYFSTNGIRKLYTLKNTTHESHMDTAYIHGYWLNLLMLKKMDAKTALTLQSSLAITFLRDTIGNYNFFQDLYTYYNSLHIIFTGYPSNCDNAQIYVKEHNDGLVEDTISYTKKGVKKLGVYPWY